MAMDDKIFVGVSSFFIQIGQMIFQNNPKPLDFSLILFLGFLKVS